MIHYKNHLHPKNELDISPAKLASSFLIHSSGHHAKPNHLVEEAIDHPSNLHLISEHHQPQSYFAFSPHHFEGNHHYNQHLIGAHNPNANHLSHLNRHNYNVHSIESPYAEGYQHYPRLASSFIK